MEYIRLGKTGLSISRIGFGGIPIQRTDVEGTRKVIDACIETGINYIDTARGYTVSEEYLGEVLEGRRDRFILATKTMARDYAGMKADIEKSLANLRTNYIDLYQIHNIKSDEEFATCFGENGAYEALLEAKREGKIGHIGATAHGVEALERLITEFEDKIETVMFPYNIVENQGEELMKKCKEKNIAFIAMKPLAGGNIDDATLAMKYILANPSCTIAIPGVSAEIAVMRFVPDTCLSSSPLISVTEPVNVSLFLVTKPVITTSSSIFESSESSIRRSSMGLPFEGIVTVL